MSLQNINFDETKQSQLPFVEILLAMGYRYISAEALKTERKNSLGNVLLHSTAQQKLMEINSYEMDGAEYKFSKTQVLNIVDELENFPIEGFKDTAEKIYNMIMPLRGGKTVEITQNGKRTSKNFRFFDFEHPEKNDFAVAVEVTVEGKKMNRRPDIVLYINGIPFVVIENKKSSVSVDEAIHQNLRNQESGEIQKLFLFAQLIIATNAREFLYGTTKTPKQFFAKWKEKGQTKQMREKAKNYIAQKIDDDLYKTLLQDLNGATHGHTQVLEREISEQDISVVALLEKSRTLDLCKNFIVHDGGIKKVMRYQQYFGIKKILDRIVQKEQTKTGIKRRGGVVWHTQGSGKSLTMVMLIKSIIELSTYQNPQITNPRILVVTDRKDLDRQIKATLQNSGLKKEIHQATSGADLMNCIHKKDARIITTLVHKFQKAENMQKKFSDLDENIFVLIDEAHRTQKGEANLQMNAVIPNACYIAFTGTPLLKNSVSETKFGKFIDKYTIDDALEDGIILPLVYEGRFVNLVQDSAEIDRRINRITKELPEDQQRYLQKQVEKKIIQDNPRRIAEIQYDIEQHFLDTFHNTGLKAQIVAPSKYSAVLFQKYFEINKKIQTAVVVSDENGNSDAEDTHKKEVEEYLKSIKEDHQSIHSYEQTVIESFTHNDEGIEILIVVDKLLTGFDAPRNTVLYLAKELKDHNLLQAIARVNRLYDNPSLQKSQGYIIDYSENAENIKTAMDLFGDYNEEDVKSALINTSEKIDELENSYDHLHSFFAGVREDSESYINHLADEADRKGFYDRLKKFIKVFKECSVLPDFVQQFEHLDVYKKELKKFLEIRKSANIQYADTVKFDDYKLALIKIMDDNIKAEEAELLTQEICITDKDAFEKAIDEMGSDKSKAEAIAAQTDKTIRENMEKDPEFFGKFSVKIAKILDAMRAKKLADIEALKQLRKIKNDVLEGNDESLPAKFSGNPAGAIFYRNLLEIFQKYSLSDQQIENILLEITEIIQKEAIIDFQKNPIVKKEMENILDDYIYDEVQEKYEISFEQNDIDTIVEKTVSLASENFELFLLKK